MENREKFRYVWWNKYFNATHLVYITLLDLENGEYSSWIFTDNCIIKSKDRFTGLKDKDGKPIWEGDIIEYDNGTKAKVIFKDGQFSGYDGYATSSDEAYLLLVCESAPFEDAEFEIEVIGNIHQDSNLLK